MASSGPKGGASATLDPRQISLSRPGAIGETRDEASNTTYGDSIFTSWHEVRDPSIGGSFVNIDDYNWQNFAAGYSSGWGSNLNWSWDPSGGTFLSPDSRTASSQLMPTGTMYLDVNGFYRRKPGSSGSSSYSVTYKVTDQQDMAKATASYSLRLHDPVEDTNSSSETILLNLRPVQIPFTKTSAGQEVTLTASFGVSYSVKVGFNGELGKKIADLLPVVPKVSLEFTATGTTTTGYSIKVNDLGVNQQTWLEVGDQYNRWSGTCKMWGRNGFMGDGTFSVDFPDTTNPYSFKVHTPYQTVNTNPGQGTGG